MKKYKVIVETLPQDSPYEFEMSAALLVASYFETDVVFLRPGPLRSPDLKIHGAVWELKSPMGDSKNTIYNCIRTARKQSSDIIVDLRRCKMAQSKAIANIRSAYNRRKRKTGTYLIIKKGGEVVDISEFL